MLSITTFISVLSAVVAAVLLVYFMILKIINIKNKNFDERNNPMWKYYGYTLYIAFLFSFISLILFITNHS